MPDGVTIPGGPSFVGSPQPPDVPCDPVGEAWRGPPGPTGPTGPAGPSNGISVKDFGARGDGTTDDTAAIQAALNAVPTTGGTVLFPPGNYIVTSTLFVPSHTLCSGPGATITAGTGFVSGTLTTWAMMVNKNYPSSPPTSYTLDTDIHFHSLAFSYVNKQNVAGGGTHAIRMYGVTLVRVFDCAFNYGNDATAFIHCDDTAVEMCRATLMENAAFDHWFAPRNARVIGNYATSTSTGATAVLFNAGTGAGTDASDAMNMIVANNVLYGCIGFDTLTTAGHVYDIRIIGNYINATVGIVGRGGIVRCVVEGNTITGPTSLPAIWIDTDGTLSPSDTTVVSNICFGFTTAPANGAGVRLTGGGVVANNRVNGTYNNALSLGGGTYFGGGNSLAAGAVNTMTGTLYADGAAQTILTNGGLGFGQLDASGGLVRFTLQSDNNHILYGTDATGAQRSIYSIQQRNSTSALTMAVPVRFNSTAGFNNTGPIAKPTVTGAKGSNAALASLMTALAAYGLVTDSTTA